MALRVTCDTRDALLLEPLVFSVTGGATGGGRVVELWTNLPSMAAPAVAEALRAELGSASHGAIGVTSVAAASENCGGTFPSLSSERQSSIFGSGDGMLDLPPLAAHASLGAAPQLSAWHAEAAFWAPGSSSSHFTPVLSRAGASPHGNAHGSAVDCRVVSIPVAVGKYSGVRCAKS